MVAALMWVRVPSLAFPRAGSSTGRAVVSKTTGCRFESYPARQQASRIQGESTSLTRKNERGSIPRMPTNSWVVNQPGRWACLLSKVCQEDWHQFRVLCDPPRLWLYEVNRKLIRTAVRFRPRPPETSCSAGCF